MITKRSAETRGQVKEDWITSYRTFSFPGYFDPRYMNYSDLVAINDDRCEPDSHVAWHKHSNMEIFGYVVEGHCLHIDSFNNNYNLPAGTVQRMSAGSGIHHIEGNDIDKTNRYLQIWIKPTVENTEPEYSNHYFSREDKLNKFCDITEKLPIKQDAKLLAGIFTEKYEYILSSNRNYYLYVVNGTANINNIESKEGDGYSFENETKLLIESKECEIILFELK